jgi:hypothetical protein
MSCSVTVAPQVAGLPSSYHEPINPAKDWTLAGDKSSLCERPARRMSRCEGRRTPQGISKCNIFNVFYREHTSA